LGKHLLPFFQAHFHIRGFV